MEKIEHVPKYYFIQGPLAKEVPRMVVDQERLLFKGTTRKAHGKYDDNKHVFVVESVRSGVKRLGGDVIVRGRIVDMLPIAASIRDAQVLQSNHEEWRDKNTEIEIVFHPNTRNRDGFFIIAGGNYTFF
jgi:hypothetical protein